MPNNYPTLHMLLLTADPSLAAVFSDFSKELGIDAQYSANTREVSEQLNRAKYEGVVLDFDTITDARPVLASVRQSRSNQNAVLFAVATAGNLAEQALQDRAHFVLRRPIETLTIKQTLDAAYDLMLGDRRRHFRYAANLPVELVVINSGATFHCSTINVSGNGLAVTTPISFSLAELLDIGLLLPDGFTVRAIGTVIWDDKHGKSGLHFQCRTAEMRGKLDSWLDSHFSQPVPGKRD